MILDFRHKLYRNMDRRARVEIAVFLAEHGYNMRSKKFTEDVSVLDYYSVELSQPALEIMDYRYNQLFSHEAYEVYREGKPVAVYSKESLYDATSDSKNPNIWLVKETEGDKLMIAWNCRVGCSLIKPIEGGKLL